MVFPLSFDSFVNLELSAKRELTSSELKSLENNIELVRDAVIATTAFAELKGLVDTLAVRMTLFLKY